MNGIDKYTGGRHVRKGLIILFLLLIITFGVIGVLQDHTDRGVKLEEQAISQQINSNS